MDHPQMLRLHPEGNKVGELGVVPAPAPALPSSAPAVPIEASLTPAPVGSSPPASAEPSVGGGVIPDLDEPPCVRPASANRNMHLTGLLVFTSTLIALAFWLYSWFSPREVDGWFPLYLLGALAILFYATFVVTIVVNSVINVFLPYRWVQQNSTFYSATPVTLPWAHRWRRRGMEHSGTTHNAAAGPSESPEPSPRSRSGGGGAGSLQQSPRDRLSPLVPDHRLPRVVTQIPVSDAQQLRHAYAREGGRSHCHTAPSHAFLSLLLLLLLLLLLFGCPACSYTEDFDLTIRPSIENALRAGRTYAKSYHTASFGLLVNEDGLQTLSPEMRQKRIDFYMQQPDLCFIARAVKGRAGRFKKASNMNFCLRWLKRALVHSKEYEISLNESLQILGAEHAFIAGAGGQFCAETTLAEPLGTYMLLLDSDSRMSSSAIFPLVSEMELDPSVGFLQCFTRPMLISHDYFEELIGVFTERLFTISFMFACSNGAPAPLIGHNALLRCHACEKVAWYDEQGTQMFWAEDKVSEDFDMSMRLSSAGFSGRYVGFDLGFTEGVSLTVLEEMSRWSKYAFGVNELMFHPLRQWLDKGVLSSTLVNFVTSTSISWYAKFGALSYMGSYYAMAVGPPVTLLNYFALSYSAYWQDTVGTAARDIFLTCVVVFGVLLPISNLVVMWRFKLTKGGFWHTIAKEVPYSFFMSVLFSGMPYHICSAILHHFLSIPISWSTTTKESHQSTRWIELKSTLSHMRVMYLIASFLIGMMAVMYWLAPAPWQIRDWQAVLPLLYFCVAHVTCPLLLNPTLMRGPKPIAHSPTSNGAPMV